MSATNCVAELAAVMGPKLNRLNGDLSDALGVTDLRDVNTVVLEIRAGALPKVTVTRLIGIGDPAADRIRAAVSEFVLTPADESGHQLPPSTASPGRASPPVAASRSSASAPICAPAPLAWPSTPGGT